MSPRASTSLHSANQTASSSTPRALILPDQLSAPFSRLMAIYAEHNQDYSARGWQALPTGAGPNHSPNEHIGSCQIQMSPSRSLPTGRNSLTLALSAAPLPLPSFRPFVREPDRSTAPHAALKSAPQELVAKVQGPSAACQKPTRASGL
ncbi:hypothetical protein AOLI_G00061640 [Acnodon oligacanthus]